MVILVHNEGKGLSYRQQRWPLQEFQFPDPEGFFGSFCLAPAYDQTLCTEGYNGQHATSVNFTGYLTLRDFIAVGKKIKMNERRCREIFDEVYQSCGDLLLNQIPIK